MRAVLTRVWIVLLAPVLAITGCGSGDAGEDAAVGDGGDTIADGSADAVSDALGGGGGTLVFDGQEITITSATCLLTDDSIQVGSVSDEGYRVQIDQNRPENPISVQILDENFLQWFPQGASGDEADFDGDSTFTSEQRPYFNNQDDRIIEASFTVECP